LQSSYDARVDSSSSTLQFIYYGNITNNSGEDFLDTELSLSTAAPSVAGRPPELFGRLIKLKSKIKHGYNNNPNPSRSTPMSNRAMQNFQPQQYQQQQQQQLHGMSQQAMSNACLDEGNIYEEETVPEIVNTMTTSSSNSMTSSIFNIPRKVTILSDNKPHKVTIESMNLNASYSYTIVPSVPKAYLKASVTNTTVFPFLAGNMNVFMDNNFVAKSNLDLVNPNESMGIFLGIDTSIKVEHQELKNFIETQGFVSKNQKQTVHLNTVVTNLKKEDIKLTIFHQLPRSTTGEVKVSLKEPQLDEGDRATAKTRLTAANNIERIATVKAGAKENFSFI